MTTPRNLNNKEDKLYVRLAKKIGSLLYGTDIMVLVAIPPLLSLLFLGGLFFLAEKVFSYKVPYTFLGIAGAIGAFISGLSGLIQIIRREAPGIMGVPVRGPWAVYTGLLWLVLCWSTSIILVVLAFLNK